MAKDKKQGKNNEAAEEKKFDREKLWENAETKTAEMFSEDAALSSLFTQVYEEAELQNRGIPFDEFKIIIAHSAMAVHETVRGYSIAHREMGTSAPWNRLGDNLKRSAAQGVLKTLLGYDARALHQSWFDERTKDGWVYGEVKNVDEKISPSLVPYDELPQMQKEKDYIVQNVTLMVVPSFLREFTAARRANVAQGDSETGE